jgi:hypothetical protein
LPGPDLVWCARRWSQVLWLTLAGACGGQVEALPSGAVTSPSPTSSSPPPPSSTPPTPPATYNDFASPSYWSTFDASSLVADDDACFEGGAFDGRYVYFAPCSPSNLGDPIVIARYDTQHSFSDPGAWSSLDLETLDSRMAGFAGAVFDGQYVYLVPYADVPTMPTIPDAILARYDTRSSFEDAGSWSTFDITAVSAGYGLGEGGGAFDGRYVYLLGQDTVARVDTQASFEAPSSWSSFSTQTIGAGCLVGAVFDGRYLYFVPACGSPRFSIPAVRYDTTADFGATESWSIFDVAALLPAADQQAAQTGEAYEYQGGAFDGRYVYFAPEQGNYVVRYDTATTSFGSAASWAIFDTSTVNPPTGTFLGATFDGRYVYLSPNANGPLLGTRYDTTSDFTAAPSWSTFDITTLPPPVSHVGTAYFAGAVFDGQYVYYVPIENQVARFDAKAPPSMPDLPEFYGSFF